MDFPRAFLVLGILSVLYVSSQLYLFFRIKTYLWICLPKRINRTLLCASLVVFLFLALFPLLWRGLVFWSPGITYPQEIRSLFAVSAVWAFGSTGLFLLIFFRDLWSWTRAWLFEPSTLPNLGRRKFLKVGIGLAAGAPFVISGHGVLMGRRRFEVEHFELPLPRLSSDLSQLTLVQLTDIHVGPYMPEEELARYVDTVNRLRPDIVALTGDFVSTSRSETIPCVQTLSGLRARYGVYACLGNHDFYAGIQDEISRLFGERGIRVLRNDAVSIPTGNSRLSVLGIDDLLWGRPSLSRAIGSATREPGEVSLLLSHRPEVFPRAARNGIDIVLSGHYHGGQIKLAPNPQSLSIARLITPYAEGLFRKPSQDRVVGSRGKDSLLFVSRGIGITGLPVRINCSPQIAHLTLVKA